MDDEGHILAGTPLDHRLLRVVDLGALKRA